MWKVYEIDSGEILKAGFEDEEEARDWLDEKADEIEGPCTVDEMDEDEEYEWQEAQDKLRDEQYVEKDELDDHGAYEPLDMTLPDELEGVELSITNQDDL